MNSPINSKNTNWYISPELIEITRIANNSENRSLHQTAVHALSQHGYDAGYSLAIELQAVKYALFSLYKAENSY